jgi:hypothetical protein
VHVQLHAQEHLQVQLQLLAQIRYNFDSRMCTCARATVGAADGEKDTSGVLSAREPVSRHASRPLLWPPSRYSLYF